MDNIQSQFVEKILKDAVARPKEMGSAFAPSNIALCKYWGKRDAALNLPVNSSLSISLGDLGTHTEISCCADADRIYLNDELLASYRIPQGKGHFIQDERFYRALKADREQRKRKYSHLFAYTKGRANKTLGVCSTSASGITVPVRPIADYLKAAEG